MRLLNTTTFEFEQFEGDNIPNYAILSHTWGKDEVTFQDMLNGHYVKKAGFTKLKGFCALAKHYKLEYAWMDTCCIDKSSSAELSEAINSMYRWYQNSAVCYAYLEDVHDSDDPEKEDSDFRKSRWFTRGWTLQELIAPNLMYFFSSGWKPLGSKVDYDDPWSRLGRPLRARWLIPWAPSIRELLSSITGISLGVFEQPYILDTYSIAQRMSWAAFRETTRPEDMAYCLMGIFDINMPLLYGEGEKKSFNRLQEEILRVTHDDTLFMHVCSETNFGIGCSCSYHPPLAGSPKGFRGLGAVKTGGMEPLFHDRTVSPQLTPQGLLVQLPICPCKIEDCRTREVKNAYIAILDCDIAGPYLDRGVILLERRLNRVYIRLANAVMSRLEFEKQEVVLKLIGPTTILRATSIQFHLMRLEKFHIQDLRSKYIAKSLPVNDRMNLAFKEIEQPVGSKVILRDERLIDQVEDKLFMRRVYLIKMVKLYFFVDEINGDAFVGILGAYKDKRYRKEDQSVPYCKVFMKKPGQEIDQILKDEIQMVIYRDEDPDIILNRSDLKQRHFSEPPSSQRATLALSNSREAVVTINSKRFLDREEHRLKLTIQKKTPYVVPASKMARKTDR